MPFLEQLKNAKTTSLAPHHLHLALTELSAAFRIVHDHIMTPTSALPKNVNLSEVTLIKLLTTI